MKRSTRMARRVAVGSLLLLIAAAGVFLWWGIRVTPQVRDRVVDALNERFASQLALESLEASALPRPRAAGTGLTLRHRGRTDVPPLIAISAFEASGHVFELMRTPVHLRSVSLEGLEIHVPPGGLSPGDSDDADDETPHQPHAEQPSPIRIDRIASGSAKLHIASRRPGRLPRVFEIHDLVLRDFGAAAGSRFEAGLTNPMPHGRIETSGVFGPWHADEPGLTPVQGDYTFKDADLNMIKGIGGILSSVGTYRGVLERIEVEGQTETPDFTIDLAGTPVNLRTTFKAIVDGTNGDTFLERVEARLNNSTIRARGSVVRTEDVKGRRVTLDVRLDGARIEDLMTLAMKSSTPPLVGRIDLASSFLLPQGDGDVIDRLRLNGTFRLAQARFTNLNVQRRITTLSRRGRGEESDEGAASERVVSNVRGRFAMRDAVLSFTDLTFAVPGSTVRLSGVYNLRTEVMDFKGELLTDATLADMTSGFKSVLARAAQPFFRREGGGTRVPIKITGPRTKPAFGLDAGRVFGKG